MCTLAGSLTSVQLEVVFSSEGTTVNQLCLTLSAVSSSLTPTNFMCSFSASINLLTALPHFLLSHPEREPQHFHPQLCFPSAPPPPPNHKTSLLPPLSCTPSILRVTVSLSQRGGPTFEGLKQKAVALVLDFSRSCRTSPRSSLRAR